MSFLNFNRSQLSQVLFGILAQPHMLNLETRSAVLHIFARQTPVNSTISALAATLTLAVLWAHVPVSLLLGWYGCLMFVAGFLLFGWWRRARRGSKPESLVPQFQNPERIDSGYRHAHVWAAISATLWGLSVFFLPYLPADLIPYMVIVIAGMSAGAATTLAAIPSVSYLYTVIVVGPYVAYFIVQAPTLVTPALPALGLTLVVGVIWAARLVHGSVVREIILRQRNANLIQIYRDERDEWLDESFAAEAYAVYDHQERLRTWNERFVTTLGIPPDLAQPGTRRDVLMASVSMPLAVEKGEVSHEEWLAHHLRLEDDSGPAITERLSNGRWIRSSARRTKRGSVITVYYDLTDIKKHEQNLAASEERFRAFSLISQDELLEVERASLVVKSWLPASGATVTNALPASPVGRSLTDFTKTWTPKDPEQIGLVEAVALGRPFRDLVFQIHRGVDGRWKRISGSPYRIDDEGIGDGVFLITITDITESVIAEQKVKAEALRSRALAKASSEVFWNLNPQGYLVSIDGIESDSIDQQMKQKVGMHFKEAFSQEAFVQVTDVDVLACIAAKKPFKNVRYKVCGKPGVFTHHVNVTGAPTFTDEGYYLGYTIAVRNITDTLRVEEQALRSAQEMGRLVDNLTASVFRLEPREDGWQTTYVNAWMGQTLELDDSAVHALLENAPGTRLSDDFRFERDVHLRRALNAGGGYQCQWSVKSESGKTYWMSERGRCFAAPDGSKFIESFVWDVTQSMEFERALVEGRERLADVVAALESAHDVIVIENAHGQVTFANSAAEGLAGNQLSALQSEGLFAILGAEQKQLEQLRLELITAIDDLGSWEKVVPVSRQGQQPRVFDIRANQMPNGGLIFAATDVSSRKQQEIQEQKLRVELAEARQLEAVGHLAGGIAHDFNNIVSSIQAFADLMLENAEPDTGQAKYTQKILDACQRAREMAEQVLFFARTAKVDVSPVPVKKVWDQTADLLESQLDDRIVFDVKPFDDPASIHGNESGVVQVLMNLVLNSVDALPDGRGTIRMAADRIYVKANGSVDGKDAEILRGSALHLTTEPEIFVTGDLNQDTRYIRLSVTDDGTGIAPADIDRIFDPFFSKKQRSKGTGLGLSVVRNVVALCGGAISVRSGPGKGTQFSVYLKEDAAVERTPVKEASVSNLPDHPVRVLIVDDEEDLSDVISTALSRAGFETTNVYSALDALEVFKDDPKNWDVIVTDQVMPGMAGTEFISQVKDIRNDVPIILCTGYSETLTKASALDLGASLFMPKPVLMTDLIAAIDTLFAEPQSRLTH